MLKRFRQLFSRPGRGLSDESRGFVTSLAEREIWILAIGLRGTPAIPFPSLTDPAAIETVAAHRKDLVEVGDDDSVFPFNYEREGAQVLPFFSTEDRAKHFLAHAGLGDISVFQPYRLMAGFVAVPENDVFALVLDPCSAGERTIAREERLFLRQIAQRA
jgi:hypothetical protein